MNWGSEPETLVPFSEESLHSSFFIWTPKPEPTTVFQHVGQRAQWTAPFLGRRKYSIYWECVLQCCQCFCPCVFQLVTFKSTDAVCHVSAVSLLWNAESVILTTSGFSPECVRLRRKEQNRALPYPPFPVPLFSDNLGRMLVCLFSVYFIWSQSVEFSTFCTSLGLTSTVCFRVSFSCLTYWCILTMSDYLFLFSIRYNSSRFMTCLVGNTHFLFSVTQASRRENTNLFSILYLSRQNPCLVTRAVYIDILFLLTHCLDKPTEGNQPGMIHGYIIIWNGYRSLKCRWGFECLRHTLSPTFYFWD